MRVNEIDATDWPILTVCQYVWSGWHITVEDGKLFLVRDKKDGEAA
jgi:hypothetical protein